MVNSDELLAPKSSTKRMHVWLPYAAMAIMGFAFLMIFLQVDGRDVNSKFLFNNPVREVIATTALAIFGFMGCLMVWNRREAFTKRNAKATEVLFCALMVVFFLTQIPFLQVQTKFAVLLGETESMRAAIDAMTKVAENPESGISEQTRKMLIREVFRDTLIESGDMLLHKSIKE